jgi:hypothetical protein
MPGKPQGSGIDVLGLLYLLLVLVVAFLPMLFRRSAPPAGPIPARTTAEGKALPRRPHARTPREAAFRYPMPSQPGNDSATTDRPLPPCAGARDGRCAIVSAGLRGGHGLEPEYRRRNWRR